MAAVPKVTASGSSQADIAGIAQGPKAQKVTQNLADAGYWTTVCVGFASGKRLFAGGLPGLE
jgi:hypothetical protein